MTTIDGPSQPARKRLYQVAGAALFCCLALAACGSSSTGSSTGTPGGSTPAGSTSLPASTPTPASAGTLSCPSASTVGGALGITVPAPSTGDTTGTEISCNYLAGTSDVLIVEDTSVAASYVASAEASLAASQAGLAFTSVSGVGDSAYSYSYSIGGLTAQGILATKGSTFIGVYATATTATLDQIKSLVNTLLG